MVQIDADIPTENMMANDTVPLYEEPVNLLVQEIREPAIYTAVISAGLGQRKSAGRAFLEEETVH